MNAAGATTKAPGGWTRAKPFTPQDEDKIIADLQDELLPRQGLTLSGGDPLHPKNLSAVRHLLERVQAECPGKNVWMWTGYKLDELTADQQQVVELINVLVDGKFVQELKDPALIWRGSSNQVIHYLR
ncbi:anaerobic ribonucleoside-triphosphate reductase activating protein [Ewingella americana]